MLLALRPGFHPSPANSQSIRDTTSQRVCLPDQLVLATVQAAHLDASPATESPKGRQGTTRRSPSRFQLPQGLVLIRFPAMKMAHGDLVSQL